MNPATRGHTFNSWSKAQPWDRSSVGPFDYWLIPVVLGIAYLIAFQPLTYLILGLAGAAGLLLCLSQPWLIWSMIAVALPFASAQSIGPAKAADLLLVAAAMLWLMDGVRCRTLQIRFSFPAALFAFFALFQMGLLLIAVDLGEAITEVIKWVEIVAILVLIPAMVPKSKQRWIIGALLMGGSLQALLGLYQFVFQVGHPSFVLLDRFMRASGTFGQPNPFAGYLGTLLPVAVSLSFFAFTNLPKVVLGAARYIPSTRNQSESQAVSPLFADLFIYGGMAALIGMGILVSWSRGGWLGTLAAVGFVLFFRSRRALIVCGVAGLFLVGMLLLNSFDPSVIPGSLQSRIGNLSGYLGVNMEQILSQPVDDDNFAIIERLAHWKAAIWMWQQAPWTGVGPGGYATVYPDAIAADPRLLRWDEPLGHAHNIYLNLLAETGLPGLLLYLSVMVGLFAWIWQRIRSGFASEPFQQALAIGSMGVLMYLVVHNGFDNLYVQGIYLHLGFWLALLSKPQLSLDLGSRFEQFL